MTTQPTTEKKLTIQIRVEPGCLGPDGKAHIETFCAAAAKIFAAVEPELVSWTLLPRYDKQLPEQEFFIDYRKLTEEQASLFLRRLGRELGKCRRPSTPCWPNWWSATSRPSDGSLPAQKVLQREPFYFRQGKRLNFALFIDPPRRSGVCKRRCLCKNVRAVTVSGRVWLFNHQKQGITPAWMGPASRLLLISRHLLESNMNQPHQAPHRPPGKDCLSVCLP